MSLDEPNRRDLLGLTYLVEAFPEVQIGVAYAAVCHFDEDLCAFRFWDGQFDLL